MWPIISSLKCHSVRTPLALLTPPDPDTHFFFHTLVDAHHTDHTPYATEAIKKVLGEDYCYDRTNTFRSLYRNFTQCQFIENEGDILFYRDARGVPTRKMDDPRAH